MPRIDLRYLFVPPQLQVVQMAAAIANTQQFKLYAVGGVVRDRLLALLAADQVNGDQATVAPVFCPDIDLVVEGGTGASIQVAIALHQQLGELANNNHDCLESGWGASRLLTFAKFQTAELFWPDFGAWGSFTLDLATARQETYAYPGANPQVQAASIEQDLYRRDLTINALAMQILPGGDFPVHGQTIASIGVSEAIEFSPERRFQQSSPVIDLFDGYADLRNQQVKPIRSGSFAEDPRRIFRAVRFAQRFGLAIAPTMRAEILATTASGNHDQIGGARLRAELNYILAHQANLAGRILSDLAELGALRCIHAKLQLPEQIQCQLRRLHKWLGCFAPEYAIRPAAIELLVSHVPFTAAELFATAANPQPGKKVIKQLEQEVAQLDLRLTAEQIKRQAKLCQLEQALDRLGRECLSKSLADRDRHSQAQQTPDQSIAPIDLIKPSQVVAAIERYDSVTMAIAAARIGHNCGKNSLGWCQLQLMWRYLTKWQQIKSPLSGDDLKALGYCQGRTIGILLTKLRAAQLDGQIKPGDLDGAVGLLKSIQVDANPDILS
jgi:tRNA nucleotidyltransferase (CCA-adding enzyme)